jgi:hypothetical protein
MADSKHDDERRGEELGRAKALVATGAPGQVVDDGDIEMPEADGFEALFAFEVLHLDEEFGKPLAQPREHAGHDETYDAGKRRYAQAAARQGLERLQRGTGFVERFEHPLAAVGEQLSGRREADASARSLEELDAGLPLEGRELLRDGRRREPERVGHGGDTPAVCQLAEDSQTADVEDDVLGHVADYRRDGP